MMDPLPLKSLTSPLRMPSDKKKRQFRRLSSSAIASGAKRRIG